MNVRHSVTAAVEAGHPGQGEELDQGRETEGRRTLSFIN